MSKFLKKLIAIFSIIIFILFVVLLLAAWSLGAFASVKISVEERGPHYFVTLEKKTLYKYIPDQLKTIDSILNLAVDHRPIPAALLFSDPNEVPMSNIVAQAGYIVFDTLEVDSSLVIVKIDRQLVLCTNVESNASIAPFKIYPALSHWIEENGNTYRYNFPALELYDDSIFGLETPLVPLTQ